MANHDLRGKDGRSGIHSEVRVLRGALVSTDSLLQCVFCVCFVVGASFFLQHRAVLRLLSKYVCVNAIYDSAVIMFLHALRVCPCMIDALHSRRTLLAERQSKSVSADVIRFVQSNGDLLSSNICFCILLGRSEKLLGVHVFFLVLQKSISNGLL